MQNLLDDVLPVFLVLHKGLEGVLARLSPLSFPPRTLRTALVVGLFFGGQLICVYPSVKLLLLFGRMGALSYSVRGV